MCPVGGRSDVVGDVTRQINCIHSKEAVND
jgi:hypothetical protein